ncbi:MAG: reductive dehalogenase, partial [Chloroflexi bacterium]|nr:reductive dehalogenase [Chloroflexota bacterium]
IEVDWKNKQRYDCRLVPQVYYANYVGFDVNSRLQKLSDDRTRQWILEKRPGYTLKDKALDIAANRGSAGMSFLGSWNESRRGPRATRVTSAAEIGVPCWEGTPEENACMIRAAARFFGASQVGFVEIDDNTRKLIYSYDQDGKKIDFENVEQAYETEDRRVIPDKARWVIVFSIQMSEDLVKRRVGKNSTPLSSSTSMMGYSEGRNVIDRLQIFLHVLGYQGLMGTWFNGLGIAPAFAVMAGLGEMSRTNLLITPEHGPVQRVYRIITDLPLAPTNPIDAGIMRFCRTCKKCAIMCPAHVLSTDTDTSWEIAGIWSSPGHKAYHFTNSAKCMTQWRVSTSGCSTCISVCPYSKKESSLLHNVIQGTVAKTTMFNRFFTRMDGFLGYDKPKNPEAWWDLDLPPYSADATHGTKLD